VQDRAGAADGTSSASGVTQVTPIVQVNATAARIGTSAATPADGELMVSGNVNIGSGSSGTPTPTADDFSLNLLGDGGMSILTPNANTSRITLGSTGDVTGANLTWSYDTLLYKIGTATAGGEMSLLTGNYVEALRIDSAGLATFSNGIAFQSATTGTGTGTGYTLDSYERGSFTPVIADASTGGNVAAGYGAQTGYYERIGNMVYISILLTNIDTTGMTAGNAVYLRALPFTSSSNSYDGLNNLSMMYDTIDVSATTVQVTPRVASNSTILLFFESLDNSNDAQTLVQDFASGSTDLYISGTYITE